MTYTKESIKKVRETSNVKIIADAEFSLKRIGNSYVMNCPFCDKDDKMAIVKSKNIFKCHSCGKGGNGGLDLLIKGKGLDFIKAIGLCSAITGIALEKEQQQTKTNPKLSETFRDQQLKSSGIKDASQISELADGKTINRYEPGAINKFWKPINGDDMILNYVDLDRNRTTFIKGESEIPFTRMRNQKPENHLDIKGKAMKYKQRAKSGSHLWYPELFIQVYEKGNDINTLIITEGEKKADKLCQHGMMAIGLMGIHNLTFDKKMEEDLKNIISKCNVKRIVFLLDSDWNDISQNLVKPIESRPRSFFLAVKKFKDYFTHFSKDGIHLDLFFAYLKKDKTKEKGIDDFLVKVLLHKEQQLVDDFEKAILDREGLGNYINCHNITTISESKLKSFWNLQKPFDLAIFNKDELKKRDYFYIRKSKYFFNELDKIESLDVLREEETFWWIDEKYQYKFKHQGLRVFLRNKGFGRIKLPNGGFRFVRLIGKILTEVTPALIADFIINFTEEFCDKPVLEMLLRGGSQYLGHEKLSRMYFMQLDFIKPEKGKHFLFFKEMFWMITKEGIVEKPYDELKGMIWSNQVLDKNPSLEKPPMIEVFKEGEQFLGKESPSLSDCHIAQFLKFTSFHSWGNHFELVENTNGEKLWQNNQLPSSKDENQKMFHHMVCKMVALGYLLDGHFNLSETKAIICMDGKETEVGTSNGGTGKSLFGQIINHLVPTVIIDGKKTRIGDDQFLYEEVDERTQVIFIDDCKANIDLSIFYGHITLGITVNAKNVKRFSRPAPKYLFTTNHAIKGDDHSSKRRQYLLSFSDWYNEFRKPVDDFGCNFFEDWDDPQWNLFYNFIACCIQTYLKFGLKYEVPIEDLNQRKLRQAIGENFLEWANLYFSKDNIRNVKIEKRVAYKNYIDDYPQDSKYCNIQKFKKKIKLFCNYSNLDFNPIAFEPGGDIKSNGKEFLIIADDDFNSDIYYSL